jgi:serine/threonine protein kinase
LRRRTVGKYELVKLIIPGNSARGIAELWQCQDLASLYYMKLWQRIGDDRNDILSLWNREVRSLMRLQSYPNSSEYFARLYDLAFTQQHYYVVLDTGFRQVLSELLTERRRYPWLLNLTESARRRSLWEGLSRIAEALGILHREGMLHRSLSTSAILANPDGGGDFRLSGFEWSLRVSAAADAVARPSRKTKLQPPELERIDPEYSTATDWFDFGLVASEMLGLPVATINNRRGLREAVQTTAHLRSTERELILSLLAENDFQERLSDPLDISRRLADVVRELQGVTISANRALVFAVRLGSSSLAKAVDAASSLTARSDDPSAQRRWIEHDLRGDIRISARLSPKPTFVLRGEKLEYRVTKWTFKGTSTWDIGYCDSVEFRPKFSPGDREYSLGQRRLEPILLPNVVDHAYKIRDRSAAWDKIFELPKAKPPLDPYLRIVHDFFRVTQQLDTLLTVAQICPVSVVTVSEHDTFSEITITPQEEPKRNDLARLLNLRRPSEQLHEWFAFGSEAVVADDYDDPKADQYSLLGRRTITGDPLADDWRFVRHERNPAGHRYIFRSSVSRVLTVKSAYLARNHGGTFAQIKRRHKAIDDLRSHESLLKLMLDPVAVSRTNSTELPHRSTRLKYDAPHDVLLKLWQMEPSFAVQGPPGTGKTTLIEAFADRLFSYDPSAQILLTAHSHHTVDDVRGKLTKLFLDAVEKPIFIRLAGKDTTGDDVRPVTERLLRQLATSDLAGHSPEFLLKRLLSAIQALRDDNEIGQNEVHSMELLVQDAANIVFTTLNSGDLAELVSRGRRFDWSIVEEAGKAHGFDMAAALQESHRLLLIGDHFQLPPFDAERIRRLLGDSARVRNAFITGAQFAPGLVDPSIVEEEEEGDSFDTRCGQWREMVTLFDVIFRRSVKEGEYPDGPASTLTNQYRMHPDIAELVGKCFYPDGRGGTIIRSPGETMEKFSAQPPYRLRSDSWITDHRIVWYDVPWIQRKEFAKGETRGLFASDVEADAIVEILEQFEPLEQEDCVIQILSPYTDQLREIRTRIEEARVQDRLPYMFSKPFDLRYEKRMGATVDEFQGSEADVIIVSLVRNNALVPWRSVGFLKEASRMNVLLSRARQKLIIVGSWDFFSSRCDEHTAEDAEFFYLGTMMRLAERMRIGGKINRIRRWA